MYDTIVIKSPEIDLETVSKIMTFCRRYEGVDIFTGELIYRFTSGELEGSFDYRIRIKVDNTEWIKDDKIPRRVETYWHIEVECSLHKILMNHNCYGGPRDIKKSIAYLVRLLESVMYVDLPNYEEWEIKRIDVARIYHFRDKNICKKIVSNLRNSYYTRRKPRIYDTSVMFSGSTTSVKIYWKGPEFEKHDYRRIKKYILKEVDLNWNKDNCDLMMHKLAMIQMKMDQVLEKAYRIIRYECEIKHRKLKEVFGDNKILVKALDDDILHDVADKELIKLIKEKEGENMDIVRRSDLVLERLHQVYGTSQANALYATWTKLVQFGEVQAKETISRATFYRHKKMLIEAGVTWNCAEVNLKQFSIVPEDFTFTNEKYVLDDVDQEVIEKLKTVA
jgi:II/X family phage/plasmid replication protein